MEKKLVGVDVCTAGLISLEEIRGADPIACSVAAARNVDISSHRSKKVNNQAIQRSDLILVMEDKQRKILLNMYPAARGKVFKLGRWLGDREVPDPFRKSHNYFELIFDLIDDAVESWVEKLQ